MMLSGWTAADYMMDSEAHAGTTKYHLLNHSHSFSPHFLSDLALDENKIP